MKFNQKYIISMDDSPYLRINFWVQDYGFSRGIHYTTDLLKGMKHLVTFTPHTNVGWVNIVLDKNSPVYREIANSNTLFLSVQGYSLIQGNNPPIPLSRSWTYSLYFSEN